MNLMDRLRKFVRFVLPGEQFDEHAHKMALYDEKYEEQERRLNDARVAVLEGRFRVRYGVAAEQELREHLDGRYTTQ